MPRVVVTPTVSPERGQLILKITQLKEIFLMSIFIFEREREREREREQEGEGQRVGNIESEAGSRF